MQQDMIVILDLGSTQSAQIAHEIRALGVYTEIHPYDITAAQLAALPNVKGIVLNGGVNRVVDGVEIDASEAVYGAGVPLLAVDHRAKKADCAVPAFTGTGRQEGASKETAGSAGEGASGASPPKRPRRLLPSA